MHDVPNKAVRIEFYTTRLLYRVSYRVESYRVVQNKLVKVKANFNSCTLFVMQWLRHQSHLTHGSDAKIKTNTDLIKHYISPIPAKLLIATVC